METNQFVLSFAAFMIVVILMFAVSQWDFASSPKAVPAYACKYDGLCRGDDCSGKLPGDMVIVPVAEDGKAYLYSPPDTYFPDQLDSWGKGDWAMRSGADGKRLFSLRETGALRVTDHAGFAADSPILAVATGQCRDVTFTRREPG